MSSAKHLRRRIAATLLALMMCSVLFFVPASASTSPASVEIDGAAYAKSSFVSMAHLLVGARLISGDAACDLLNPDAGSGTLGLYRPFTAVLDFAFPQEDAGGMYCWKLPSVRLGSAVTGEVKDGDGLARGQYLVDAEGGIYVVLNDAGAEPTPLAWRLQFDASWDEAVGGQFSLDLGDGHQADIRLDTGRADVTADSRRVRPGLYEITVRIRALDDLAIMSIADTVTVRDYDQFFSVWCETERRSIADSYYLCDAALSYPDADGVRRKLRLDENLIGIDASLPAAPDGGPRIRYRMELDTPVSVPMDAEAILTYRLQLDPECVRALDLSDAAQYTFQDEVKVYLEDGSVASDSCLMRDAERSLIGKECAPDGSVAEWTIVMRPPHVYALDGMLVTDTLAPELQYLTDQGFVCTYGNRTLTPSVYPCGSQDEFDRWKGDAAGSICLWNNSFKYFLPAGVGMEDAFTIQYKTTFDGDVAEAYGEARLYDPVTLEYDAHSDRYVVSELKEYHDGIHTDEEGALYTNWTIEVSVPAHTECERFFLEDYVPMCTPDGSAAALWDTLHLTPNFTPDDARLSVYSDRDYNPAQVLRDRGILLSIMTESGHDVTWDVLYKFVIEDVRAAGDNSRYFTVSLADKVHYKEKIDKDKCDGISAQNEGYTVTLTIPMYLNGEAATFPEHTNHPVWYYDDAYHHLSARSTINLVADQAAYAAHLSDSGASPMGPKLPVTEDERYVLANGGRSIRILPFASGTLRDCAGLALPSWFSPGSALQKRGGNEK